MFSCHNSLSVIFVVVTAFAGLAFAEIYGIKGDFVEHRNDWEYGFITGTFKYLYDSTHPTRCRLRLDYNVFSVGNDFIVTNLYQYEDEAMYSWSPVKCTGVRINEHADPWWFDDELYVKSSTENGMAWYKRIAVPPNNTGQVKEILMIEDVTAPSDGYLGAINFYDGRKLTFSNVVIDTTFTTYSALFSARDDCPKATCPIYADIVFVLDSSGSVNNTEWAETVNFVNLIANSFTFGDSAVAAAVVQFNGQDDGCTKKWINNDPMCGSRQRYPKDCKYPVRDPMPKPDLMTTIIAGEPSSEGGVSVSTDKDMLMRAINLTVRSDCVWPPNNNKSQCQAFSGWRGTCQALGLDMAMQVFEHSPRNLYNKKPNRIVIVVTDGEDKYPNMTAANATVLKEEYNATLIEVGVGLECMYDIHYLRSIATRLGPTEESAFYFNAVDYDEIRKVADDMFRPLCDPDFSSHCGPECKGFCGAGVCYCPDCVDSEDVCHVIKCSSAGTFSEGCLVFPDECSDAVCPDDVCRIYSCDANAVTSGPKKGSWKYAIVPCTEEKANNPGTCRTVSCDSAYGGCRVDSNSTYCQELAKGRCELWECAGEDVLADDNSTGCKMLKNFTKECEDNLGARSACTVIECNGKSNECVDMERDICKEKDNACWVHTCEDLGDGTYGCVARPTAHNANTQCVEWICNNATGWSVSLDRTKNSYCKNRYKELKGEDALKCQEFGCDPNVDHGWDGGCYNQTKEGCSSECSDEIDINCLKAASGTVDQCTFDYCYVKVVELPGGDKNYTPVCASEVIELNAVNCLDENSESAIMCATMNMENPSKCFTPTCDPDLHRCGVVEVPLPDGMIATKCMEPECFKDETGVWSWRMVPTQVNSSCVSDGCYSRVCDPEEGCVPTDICTVKTNDCYSYSCVKNETGHSVCLEKDLTVDFLDLECIHEKCVNGTTKFTWSTECVSEDKCMKGSCVKGFCNYTMKKPSGNDLCMEYTCDPKTGNWTVSPKCDDGLFCTIDECWNYVSFIECHHRKVDCASRLNMDGYDCFVPACKENIASGTFRCMRKLLPNAYIDICGNCIKNIPDEDASETQESEENMLLSCTGAPPKPIMVETLAAATIGLIIIAAIVVGAGFTASTVIGTKTLISRVKAANNQSAVSNPLYEGCDTELQNPTYGGAQ